MSAQRAGRLMSRRRACLAAAAAGAAATPAWAQYASGYTYVKMSLGLPWALYFVFLAGVLLPFVVMIVLAWRSAARAAPELTSATSATSAKNGGAVGEPTEGGP